MLKATLILLILFVVSVIIVKILTANMTPKEHAEHIITGEYPTRITIVGVIMLLTFIGAIVCGILTIITW